VAIQVAWSESALASLSEAIEYIAKDSPSYAAALAVQAERAGTSLQQLANRGRIVPEYKDASVREIPVGKSYRLIYKAEAERASVIAFVHIARDLASLIEDTSW
jgi:plasmid stabilization system protein ParE